MTTPSRIARATVAIVLVGTGVVMAGLIAPQQTAAVLLLGALLWLCRLAYTSSFPPKELQLSDEAEIELRRKLQDLAKRRKAS